MSAPSPPAVLERRFVLFGAAALLLAAILWYPLRHASPYADDYLLMALGKHLVSPWPLLVEDSGGAFYFRPLVMALWWFTMRALGDGAPAHHALNLIVHALNGILLAALLRQIGTRLAVAAIAGLAFLAHPATFSSASWLCLRFDLLAVTFGLAGLIAIERHRGHPSAGSFAAALVCIAASIFSKENGFGMAAVAFVALLWPRATPSGRDRLALAGAIAMIAVFALAVRPFILRDVPEAQALRDNAIALLSGGAWKWSRSFPGFLIVAQGSLTAVAFWLAAFTALLVALLFPRSLAMLRSPGPPRAAAIGAGIMILAVLAQATIMGQVPLPVYTFAGFEVGPLFSSRFYYMPLAGFALTAAAGAEIACRAPWPRWTRLASFAFMALAVVSLAVSSRSIGRDWAAHTEAKAGRLERAAVQVVSALDTAAPGCKVYLLDLPYGTWHFREAADVGVKQRLPRGHRALSCFIQSEHAPWYHLLARAPLPPDAYEPLEIIRIGGKPFEPLVVGNLAYYYLRIPDADAVRLDPAARFFAWRGDRFEEVTGEVRSGRRTPRFFDNRPQR